MSTRRPIGHNGLLSMVVTTNIDAQPSVTFAIPSTVVPPSLTINCDEQFGPDV